MLDDPYAPAVPFYDLFHEDGHVPAIRESLPPLLDGVRRGVIEIGAGTGLITEVIARATPGEIYAVEPSPGMRSVLVNRLAHDPELLRRVTVLPCGGLDVKVDEPAQAVVMISVLQSFTAAERPELWRVLAGHLETDGRLVFNWRDRDLPRPEAEPGVMGSYTVGRHTYEVAGQVLDVTGDRVTSRFLYRVRQGDLLLSEDEVVSTAHRPAGAVLAAELKEAGFVRDDAPDGMQVWRAS
ncbi:class I SAM-dependent methyltransferase [Nonomuraea sp. NPDC049419]|uniref:class I SAM-dependent methyltransferase n=1 Tax=Nonomuraea sp. NPDC049419 TaxID=3155772 RepID=UPI00341D0857